MKMRNLLIALIVVAAGISGGVTMFTQPNDEGRGQTVVINRSAGVAYAQAGLGQGPAGGGGGAPPAEQAAEAPAAETPAAPKVQLSDEEWLKKLEEWKNSDPRDIIKAKYDDLQAKETHPDNEDNPEEFIPETSRVDPLTPVLGAMPDELKPPRGGDDDPNEAETYLYTAAATEVVDYIGLTLQVYNVLQIGLTKIVTIEAGGNRYNLNEGQPLGLVMESSQGIPVQAQFAISAASSDEVTISVSGTPWGSTVNVTKDFTYIPR
jgi:hypothetical protein